MLSSDQQNLLHLDGPFILCMIRNADRGGKVLEIFLFLVVILINCLLFSARYSSDALGRSRIIVITDFLNSSDGDKLISSLENKDVELVFLQRDSPSSVQGSVDVLSGEEKR